MVLGDRLLGLLRFRGMPAEHRRPPHLGIPFWNLSFGGIWLIFLVGYFHFYVAAILVIGMKTDRRKIPAIGLIYSVPIIMNIIGKGIFHWAY